MLLKRTFPAALLGTIILAGCNGGDDKHATNDTSGTYDKQIADLKAEFETRLKGQDDVWSQKLAKMTQDYTDGHLSDQSLISALQTVVDKLGKDAEANKAANALGNDTLEKRISDLEKRPTVDPADIAKLREALDKATGDDTAAHKLLSDRLDRLEALTIALQETKADKTAIDTLNATIKTLQDQLAQMAKDAADKVAKLEQRIAQLELINEAGGPRVDQDLAGYVNTTRGSAEGGEISKGNTFPATAMPFGFNMWTPVNTTNEGPFYEATPGKNILAFAVTHEASKWNGNHQAFKFMPVKNERVDIADYPSNDPWFGKPSSSSYAGESFQRKNEIAKAHYYSVTFDNGMQTEITPTNHAAYIRFTAPDTMAKITIAFDQFFNNDHPKKRASGALTFNQADGTASGYTAYGASDFTPQLYFYIKFDGPITNSQDSSGDVKGWVQFDTPADSKVVGMSIATSFISVEQAKDNLEQEIAGKSFDDVKTLAEKAWNDKLNMVQVQGASEDQKTILYSNMYRSFLYPNSAWENAVDPKDPTKRIAQYSSPYTRTDKIKPGKIWVNNGFWDTYRTTWPLYALLIPKQSGEMLNGFVNGFKDGGWTTRWSNPGYVDSMVATSADVTFADAYVKGIRNFDVAAAYQSMLRNATTYSKDGDRGRKGMATWPFYGYMPKEVNTNDPGQNQVSWSLEGSVNDFGIAQIAATLNHEGKVSQNYADEATYFTNRARNYALLFDNITKTGTWTGGWFRRKNQAGEWASAGDTQSWGYGYCEGNAWSYAFLAPQDGQGLANLYGGRDKLKAKLDTFFTTKPTRNGGSYGSLHEANEADEAGRLANVGEYQHSNQPVHHSIYMYNYAGAPAEGQRHLRDVMDKLYFTGFDANHVSNGEGYIGDEDNGEMSAWYVLSAMGIYPVSVGRPEYAIGAPYFEKMTVWLQARDGETITNKPLTIRAPGVSATNRYVQSVKLNGKPLSHNYIKHSDVADGGTLDFVMGPNKSDWGTGTDDVPTSITQGDAKPAPLVSILPVLPAKKNEETGEITPSRVLYVLSAGPDKDKEHLIDRNSSTEWASSGAGASIEATIIAPRRVDTVKLYTLTSSATAGKDPTGWALEASNDGTTWTTLDERKDQTFTWRQQTRPFAIKTPGNYARYRLKLNDATPVNIAEFELLADPQTP
ncbi:putative alpha-1,2-mannosidase [Phyllobacterium sp. 1468]|uniref:GH92 family glycosyl hydrolase n=1 Tax=Phyllobacterium sp. 1468 TaxID=2817759 RepID=UPI002865FBF3|nr:GH92 family glycosyl hydrolase [Phyllobacterium sp. 1468]MDR6631834.1 putative alpha-1,2-mannosidase [Phyllobacterium sp. 1468]